VLEGALESVDHGVLLVIEPFLATMVALEPFRHLDLQLNKLHYRRWHRAIDVHRVQVGHGPTNRGNPMLKMLERIREARREDEEAGFTLIELLIVIVILGVLAGIVVFSVQGIQDRGRESACRADVATVQTAEEAYYASMGTYTTNWTDLTTQITTGLPDGSKPFGPLLKNAPTGTVDLVGTATNVTATGKTPCSGYTAGNPAS
jgi:general secretion pathway protein G